MWSAVEEVLRYGSLVRWVNFQHDKFETCDVSTRC